MSVMNEVYLPCSIHSVWTEGCTGCVNRALYRLTNHVDQLTRNLANFMTSVSPQKCGIINTHKRHVWLSGDGGQNFSHWMCPGFANGVFLNE